MKLALAGAHVIGARMRATPALVAFGRVLAMSSSELHEFVDEELARNPALELTVGSTSTGRFEGPARPAYSEGDLPGLAALASRSSRTDRLMADVGPLIDSEDRWIAQYIAGDLDRHGILGRTIADVAEALGTGIDRIEKVVGVFRRVISPGLCAANLRESLLLHVLAHTSGSWATLLAAIIQDHLNDAATNNLDAIARATQTDTGTVRQALDFLRERIPAYPLYDEEEPPPAGSCEDVIVRWSEEDQPQGLSIEVVDHSWSRLRIDDVYADIAHRSSLQPPPNIGRGSWTEIQDQVRRAQELLDLVHGRTNTLGRVAREAATYQWRFLREGKRFHRPLTRAQVADTLDLHESTVSRCVAGKSIRMLDGTVQPLTVLFGGAVSTQTALAELIRAEQSALSDASLAEQLTQLGHPVCRRTVAKYRALLDIPAQAGRQQRLRLPATGAV